MRKLLALLLMLPVIFPCTTVVSTELINSTTPLGQFECLYFLDLNYTIGVADLRQNSTYEMTPYQERTDSVSNSRYVCNYDALNINMTMPYGGSYDNDNHNLHIRCPAFPQINEFRNIEAGSSYYYSAYNLTINATHKNYNINDTLDFGESYDNNDVNIHLRTLAPANLTQNIVLVFNETRVINGTNITVSAPPYPYVGQVKNLMCGEKAEFSELGIQVNAPACINQDVNMLYGDVFSRPEYGLNVYAPTRVNENWQLKAGETKENTNAGIAASCVVTPEEYASWCRNITEEDVIATWTPYNLENYTCNNMASVCIDNLTTYCTNEEKLGGPGRFLQCYNRNLEYMTTKVADAESRATEAERKMNSLIEKYNEAENAQKNAIEVMVEFFLYVSCVLAISAGFIYFLIKKKRELDVRSVK